MILLQPVVEILAVAMAHTLSQNCADRSWVAVMAVVRHARRCDPGDHLGRCKECLGGGHVAALTEHDVDQRAGAIDGAVEIPPPPMDLDVGFIDIPTAPCLSAPASPQIFRQRRRELARISHTNRVHRASE